jgi:hypothetical protein
MTNKRGYEDQMVALLVAYDAMAQATASIPELAATSTKFAPAIPEPAHLAFTENAVGTCKLMKLVEVNSTNKWANYHPAMKYLPRALRMHLAGRPSRLQEQRDEMLPVLDDGKVRSNYSHVRKQVVYATDIARYATDMPPISLDMPPISHRYPTDITDIPLISQWYAV